MGNTSSTPAEEAQTPAEEATAAATATEVVSADAPTVEVPPTPSSRDSWWDWGANRKSPPATPCISPEPSAHGGRSFRTSLWDWGQGRASPPPTPHTSQHGSRHGSFLFLNLASPSDKASGNGSPIAFAPAANTASRSASAHGGTFFLGISGKSPGPSRSSSRSGSTHGGNAFARRPSLSDLWNWQQTPPQSDPPTPKIARASAVEV